MKKIILMGIFSIILVVFFLNEFTILNVEVYPVDAYIVENEVGFNLDTDKIHFGNVPLNSGGAYRQMSITNVYDEDVKVFLSDSGMINEFVYFEVDGENYENYNFVLKSNETKDYKIVFKNENLPLGYYDGEIKIVVRKLYKFN
ncbi:hypothetical protein J4467_00095 [Candidatus Woesearchaeota archaeon]|nr:hypothetical protein [Candidatus Woesearchaeota archaeon]